MVTISSKFYWYQRLLCCLALQNIMLGINPPVTSTRCCMHKGVNVVRIGLHFCKKKGWSSLITHSILVYAICVSLERFRMFILCGNVGFFWSVIHYVLLVCWSVILDLQPKVMRCEITDEHTNNVTWWEWLFGNQVEKQRAQSWILSAFGFLILRIRIVNEVSKMHRLS